MPAKAHPDTKRPRVLVGLRHHAHWRCTHRRSGEHLGLAQESKANPSQQSLVFAFALLPEEGLSWPCSTSAWCWPRSRGVEGHPAPVCQSAAPPGSQVRVSLASRSPRLGRSRRRGAAHPRPTWGGGRGKGGRRTRALHVSILHHAHFTLLF